MGGGGLPVETIQLLIAGMNMFIGAATMLKYPAIAMVLIVLFGLYSGLEGVAIGVADNQTDAWASLWNKSLLEIHIAIGIGIGLFKLIPHRPFFAPFAYLFLFIVSTPIGVGIGVCIDASTERKVTRWIFVVSSGFIAGNYICDVVGPLISKGFRQQKPCYFDMSFVISGLLGVGVMAVALICDGG